VENGVRHLEIPLGNMEVDSLTRDCDRQ